MLAGNLNWCYSAKFTDVNLVKHLTNTSIISLGTQYLHILALLYAVGIPSRHYKNNAINFSFLEFDECHRQADYSSDTTGQTVTYVTLLFSVSKIYLESLQAPTRIYIKLEQYQE